MTMPANPQPDTASQPQSSTPQKPWYMKWWVWLIAAVLIIGGIGKAVSGDSNSTAKEPVAAEEPVAPEEPAVEMVTVPDFAGLPGDEARDALKELGLVGIFEADSGKAVFMESNWDVISTTPASGEQVQAGGQVKVLVKDARERVSAEVARNQAERDATPVDAISAQALCDNYADLEFPYGVKMHWIMGKLAEEPREEGGWYLKVTATVTNEYKAKREMNIECHVSGTNGAPAMDDFLAY